MPNYATLEEVKDYLNLGTLGTSNDVLLQTFINSSSKRIEDFVGYTFDIEYGSDESLYNVHNLDMIVLRKYPIVGISSIESGVDYQARNDVGIIILDEPFTGDFSLSVSFGQKPPDTVKTACMELVNLFWSRRQSTGLKKMSMGDFSFEIGNSPKSEIDSVLDILKEYRDLNGSVTVQSYNQQR